MTIEQRTSYIRWPQSTIKRRTSRLTECHREKGSRRENGVPRRENRVPRREKGGTEKRKRGCPEEKKGVPRREKGDAQKRKRGCLEKKLYFGATVLICNTGQSKERCSWNIT